MHFLDVPTLLQVSGLFNLTAALAWLALAQLFRIAPRAGRLMAAAHVLRFATQGCTGCLAGWTPLLRVAVTEFGALACMVLLLLALRRMVRSRLRPRDIMWIGGLGAASIAAGLAAGSGLLPQLASTAAVTLLAGLAVREVVRGVARALSTPITAFTALPFVVLVLLGTLHFGELLVEPGWAERALRGDLPTPWRAVLWCVVTLGLTLSLIALMIWRVIARIQH
ncbi:MAG: hypothetical protein EOP73_28210, partial [Variovorax sp.]